MRLLGLLIFSFMILSTTAQAADYSQCSMQTPVTPAPETLPIMSLLPGNFHKVNSFIYRGARIESPSQAQALMKLGIKTVINLQGGDLNSHVGEEFLGGFWPEVLPDVEPGETPNEIAEEGAELEKAGLLTGNYLSVPIDSLSLVRSNEESRIEKILNIINDPKTPRPIYIHCAHGADRTGLMVALYRVLTQNICMNTAHQEWQSLGHDYVHTAFTSAMDEFYYQFLLEKIYLGLH